jgi:hypothetical protein
MQIGRKGLKHPYRLGVTIWRHSNNDFFAANIQTSRIGMDTAQIFQLTPLCRRTSRSPMGTPTYRP